MTLPNRTAVRLALAVVGLIGLSACATITRGTTESFTVESTPPGAKVRTSHGFACDATPCTWKLPRKDAFRVTVTKDGYQPYEAQIRSSISSDGTVPLVGNWVLGGVIGVAVDYSTGAAQDLQPNPLRVTLDPAAGSASAVAGGAAGGE